MTGNDVTASGGKTSKDGKKSKKSKIVSDPHPPAEVKIIFPARFRNILSFVVVSFSLHNISLHLVSFACTATLIPVLISFLFVYTALLI